MGGFEEKKKEEGPEAPTAELYKSMATEWPDKVMQGAAVYQGPDPWAAGMDASAPVDWSPNPTTEALHEMHEGNELIGKVANPLSVASSLADATKTHATVQERASAGVGAASGIAALGEGSLASSAGLVGGGFVMGNAMRNAGDAIAKKTGLYGQNEDGTNRDSVQFASHAGDVAEESSFGDAIRIGPGGITTVKDSGNKVIGGAAALGAGAVTAVADVELGLGATLVDGAKALNPLEMAKEYGEQKRAEDEREEAFNKRLEATQDEETKRNLLRNHVFAHYMGDD